MKEKYYINEKTHLATEKDFVLQPSLKINKWVGGGGGGRGGVLINSGRLEKNRKINQRPPRLLGT